jgi:hypothetical protein
LTSIEVIEPSLLWETKAGYREMPIQIRAVDVMADGRRRGLSGTGAVDPTSRARYTGRNMNIGIMYTNISNIAYPVFGVCTLAMQWECM